MKKIIAILLLPLFLCSCQESEQINEIAFVKILAIDYEDSQMLVTAGIQYPKTKQGEDAKDKANITVRCASVSEGLSLLERKTDKKMFFGQISCVVLGEDMAKEGIVDTLDYLVRADEMRFDIPVLVVKGEKAQKLIEDGSESESHISEKITKLLESGYSTSYSGIVELSSINEMIEDPYAAPYMPYVIMGKEKGDVTIEGYCVFKKDKLCAFLEKEYSLGVNFLNNSVNNWVYVAQIEGDKKITLKISKVKSKLKLEHGIYKIKVNFMSEVLQADSTVEKFDTELNQLIIEDQNGKVRDIVDKTMKRLKYLGCDVAAFGDTFHNEEPKIAQSYIGKWSNIFSHVTYEIDVDSKLDPSKTAGKPVKQGGE